jgi:hypothetical protein
LLNSLQQVPPTPPTSNSNSNSYDVSEQLFNKLSQLAEEMQSTPSPKKSHNFGNGAISQQHAFNQVDGFLSKTMAHLKGL